MKGTLPQRVRLGVFEVDLRAGELRQDEGAVLVLSDQPLQILRILIEADGEIVTRDEIRQRLWPDDTVVEFDHSINNAIKKLRRALVDSGDEPHYIGTIAKRGYRLLVPVERIGAEADGPAEAEQTPGPSIQSSIPEALGRDGTTADKSLSVGQTIAEPRRRSRWKWLAVGAVMVCAVAVASVFYWRMHRAPKLTERDTIVLADFDNKTGDPVFDDTLKQALTIQLEQSPFLNVLSDEKVEKTLKLMNRPANVRLTREVAQEVCLRTNSKALLAGRVASVGDHYLIGLKAVNCQTGDTLASAEVEADNRNHVLKALSDVGTQLRANLGESLASVQKFNQPLEEVTTSSLEALQAYTQGNMAHSDPEKVAYFKRAIELDPNFAIAYADLGTAYGYEAELSSKYASKAYELRDRVSLRERFSIESTYYETVTGEAEKIIQTYLEWIQSYPDDYAPHVWLSARYRVLGYYEKALEQAKEAVRIQPGLESYNTLAACYFDLNRMAEAKAELRRLQTIAPDQPSVRQLQYFLAFVEGDTATMTEVVKWGMGTPGAEPFMILFQSSAELYHGHLGKAQELAQRAQEAAARSGEREAMALMRVVHAPGEAAIGATVSARKGADEALALDPKGNQDLESSAALTFALLGETAKARKLVEQINKEAPLDTMVQTYTLPTIRAAIEVTSNHPSQAIDLLKIAEAHELGATNVI